MENITPTTPASGSQLFLIRLWVQPDAGAPGWQGKLQPLLSGEAYRFGDWAALVDLLVRLVDPLPIQDASPEETTEEFTKV